MQKGFSVSFVVIFIVLFIATPIIFWWATAKNNFSVQNDIKGASTYDSIQSKNGLLIEISSKQGTWDLFEYLCKTKEECVSSLLGGKRWGTVSGGTTSENHQVIIESSDEWDNNKYLKLFVKSGWGSPERKFGVSGVEYIADTSVETTSYEGDQYQVVVLPLDSVKLRLYKTIVFSDQ